MKQVKRIDGAAILRVKSWLDLRVNCVPGLERDLRHLVDVAEMAISMKRENARRLRASQHRD